MGRLFNNNELIVAEVLQSAEAMKAAVNHLEQFMEKADTATRGKVVLATVKGDVHDIGKNLVEIILTNNGYEVVNLGIKVPPEELIKAYQEHQPDAIGLSGLLVKSAQQMVITANDLKDAGIGVPLLVGGAALTEKFTQTKIAPTYGEAVCYAKDAMTGLRLMNELMDPATRERVISEQLVSGDGVTVKTTVKIAEKPSVERSPKVRTDLPIPVGGISGPQGAPGTGSDAKCGAISIRSCCTDDTWGTRAISKSGWRNGRPRLSNCLARWKK